MGQTSVWRFNGCLVAIGFSLLLPAMLGLLLATGFGLLTLFAGTKATVDSATELKATTASALRKADLPESVVDDFLDDQRISETTLASLTGTQKAEAMRIMQQHDARLGGAALGTAMGAGLGFGAVVIAYALGIPAFIVGLLLVLRRKVWKCEGCGFIFDRA